MRYFAAPIDLSGRRLRYFRAIKAQRRTIVKYCLGRCYHQNSLRFIGSVRGIVLLNRNTQARGMSKSVVEKLFEIAWPKANTK